MGSTTLFKAVFINPEQVVRSYAYVRCNHPSVSRDGQRELFFFGYVNCFRTDFTELAQEWFIVLSECLIFLTRKDFIVLENWRKNYIVL